MAYTSNELQAGFLIGDCRIYPSKNLIVRGDTESRLEPRVMNVLVCLAARAGEVVPRETLNQEVWTNIIVTDQAVTNCISELRQHLGDDRTTHRVIETVPKRGYSLVAPVSLVPAALPPGDDTRPATAPPARNIRPHRRNSLHALVRLSIWRHVRRLATSL